MPADWAIIETMSSSEELVERGLRQSGYRVYLPRYRRLLSPHGRHRKPITAMRPLFPRLIFAHDWRGWPLARVSGVIGRMSLPGGRKALLSDADVRTLMVREHDGEFDDVKHPVGGGLIVREDLKVGDEVEVDMPGERIRGVLKDLSPAGQAIVEIMIFGRLVPTTTNADALHAVLA